MTTSRPGTPSVSVTSERMLFDRALLKRFAAAISAGQVCDIGCGPGHVMSYLESLGLDAF